LDEFFQRLREIQKKERSLSGLSPVGDNFYREVFRYLDGLMEKIGNNQLSLDSYLLLRDAQRIVAEICERREHKVTNSAVMNVQRSYQLFVEIGNEQVVQTPLNSTSEEKDLYKELFASLAQHRKEMNFPISSSSIKKRKKLELRKDSSTKKDSIGLKDQKEASSTEWVVETDISPPISPLDTPPIDDEIYRQFGQEPGQSTNKIVKRASDPDSAQKPKSRSKKVSKPVTDSGAEAIPTEVLMITAELPSIMGVDHTVYGPMYPGDVITIPEANARILIKKDKGRPIQRYK